MTDPKWISQEEACKIAGKDTLPALRAFIIRWNHDHLDDMILCIVKKVDEHSLRRAIRMEIVKRTPGMKLRKVISDAKLGNRLIKGAR